MGAPATRIAGDRTWVGSLLRAARERAGLTVREVAARLGISASTVSAAEGGADLRLSTLQAWASSLDGLTASLLIHGEPAPDSFDRDEAWRAARDAAGLEAEAVAVEAELEPDGTLGVATSVTGMRSLRPAGRAGLERLVATTWIGTMPPDDAASRLARGATVEVEDGRSRHVARLRNRATVPRLDYEHHERRIAGVALPWGTDAAFSPAFHSAAGFALSLHAPVGRLELALRVRGGSLPPDVRPCAWPAGVLGSDEEIDLAPSVAPLARIRREPGRLRVILERPLAGFSHGLLWGEGRPRPERSAHVAVAATPVGSPGAAIRRAREQAGISRRELARRTRLSISSVIAIEAGRRDLRLSSLRRLLEALPALRAEHLLRDRGCALPWTAERSWRLWRDLLGFQTRLLRLAYDLRAGRVDTAVRVVESRTLPGRGRKLNVITRVGRGETLRNETWTEPVRMRGSPQADEVTLRFVREGRHLVGLVHVVPAEVAAAGLTTSSRGARRLAPGEELPAKFSEAVLAPLERLEIGLRLPAELKDSSWEARAWPACEPDDPPRSDAWPRLGGRPAVRRSAGGLRVELAVERPPPGFVQALVRTDLPGITSPEARRPATRSRTRSRSARRREAAAASPRPARGGGSRRPRR